MRLSNKPEEYEKTPPDRNRGVEVRGSIAPIARPAPRCDGADLRPWRVSLRGIGEAGSGVRRRPTARRAELADGEEAEALTPILMQWPLRRGL
jgi:hypothetical protein